MTNYDIVDYENKYLKQLQKLFVDFSFNRVDGVKLLKREEIFGNVESYLIIKNVKVFVVLSRKTNSIVGFISGKIIESNGIYTEKKIFGNIDYLFVSKDFRGQGISTKLKNKYIDFLKKKNVKEIRLKVLETNKKAKNIYEKWGFGTLKYEMNSII